MQLTAPLVSRLHNNLLVVEVWQRSQAPGQDRLVGLSRLPLERLYLTFSQPDVTDTVLQMKVRWMEDLKQWELELLVVMSGGLGIRLIVFLDGKMGCCV